ncbi:MAG: hypothetical protein R2783_08045 [Gelidibacter sp.]
MLNDWSTSYAGHFMIEAEKKGCFAIDVQEQLIEISKTSRFKIGGRCKTLQFRFGASLSDCTLALAGSPDLAAMNRLRSSVRFPNEAKWRLAAAYALAGQSEASKKISSSANINFQPPKYNYY